MGLAGLGQAVEQAGADIARHHHGFAGALYQLAGQRRHCGFAIGARDGDDCGRVLMLRLKLCQGVGEDIEFAAHGHMGGACRFQQAGQTRRRQTGAHADTGEVAKRQRAGI